MPLHGEDEQHSVRSTCAVPVQHAAHLSSRAVSSGSVPVSHLADGLQRVGLAGGEVGQHILLHVHLNLLA
jgi:hypothetical protein